MLREISSSSSSSSSSSLEDFNLIKSHYDCLSNEKINTNEEKIDATETENERFRKIVFDPTDMTAVARTSKTFTRRRTNSITNEQPVKKEMKILDLTDRNVVEIKTPEKIESIHEEKKQKAVSSSIKDKRRRYSEGATSLHNLGSSGSSSGGVHSIDLSFKTPIINSNTSSGVSSPRVSTDKQSSNPPSPRKFKASITEIKIMPSRKRASTSFSEKKAMKTSTSDNAVSRSPKERNEPVQRRIDSFVSLLYEMKDDQTIIFDEKGDVFCFNDQKVTISDDRVKCVKRVLADIDMLVTYVLLDMGSYENIRLLGEIIKYLESAKWSRSVFDTYGKEMLNKTKESVEKLVQRDKKQKVEIANEQMKLVNNLFMYCLKSEAIIFYPIIKEFCIVQINKTKTIDIANSVKLILEKIKLLAEHNLTDRDPAVDLKSLSEIIDNLQKANWSAPLFSENSKYFAKKDLDVAKKTIEKAIDGVKNQIMINNESLSTMLVGVLLEGMLEPAEPLKRLTLNDLSLVFPKTKLQLHKLLDKVFQLLVALNIEKAPLQMEPSQNVQHLLDFCLKCFENQADLRDYVEHEEILRALLQSIYNYATDDMKMNLNLAFERALSVAKETQLSTAKSRFLEIKKSGDNENLANNDASKSGSPRETGFYHLYKEALNNEEKNGIIDNVARSIVKKTALGFILVPLNELLSSKLDDKSECLFYNQMCASINNLSFLVASEILYSKNVVDRRKVISFYVKVIEKCAELGDLASSNSLRMGFDLPCISRLYETCNKEISELMQPCKDRFDAQENYKKLSVEIHNYNGGILIIPPVISRKKLILINDCHDMNSMHHKNEKVMIDQFALRCLSRDVIIPIRKTQKALSELLNDVDFTTDETFDKIIEGFESLVLSEIEYEELSHQLEPKK